MPKQEETFAFKGCRLTNVYGRIRPEQADEVIRLWRSNGVVAPAEAARRCREVVFTIHNEAGDLIGVNTVYVADFRRLGTPYYFYRTFIRASDRGVSGLPELTLRLTCEFLRGHPHPQRPAGVIIETENPKLMRRAQSAKLARLGFRKLGTNQRGQDVLYHNFDGSHLASA